MVDVTLITSFLSSIDYAMNIGRTLNATASSLKNAILKAQVADLMDALADQKVKMAEIKNILINKEEEIQLLNKKMAESCSKEKPEYFHGIYRFKNDEGNYCTRCWDDKMKKFRVTRTTVSNNLQCPECKSNFSTLS